MDLGSSLSIVCPCINGNHKVMFKVSYVHFFKCLNVDRTVCCIQCLLDSATGIHVPICSPWSGPDGATDRIINLVGGLEHVLFSNILGIIIPID